MGFTDEEQNKWIEWEINSKAFLNGKTLKRKTYPVNAGHTHCEFCWDKFGKGSEDRKEGYYEKENNCWICDDCYEIFKGFFHWTIEKMGQGTVDGQTRGRSFCLVTHPTPSRREELTAPRAG